MVDDSASPRTPVPGSHAADAGSHGGRQQLWAALAAVVPLALLTCLMAVRGNFACSVPVGFVCSLVSAAGISVLLRGSEHESRPTREGDARATLKSLLFFGAATLAFVLVLRVAVEDPDALIAALATGLS